MKTTHFNIKKFMNKIVNIKCNDGEKLIGKLINYTSALDNEPDGESITIKDGNSYIEIFTEEIEKIELTD